MRGRPAHPILQRAVARLDLRAGSHTVDRDFQPPAGTGRGKERIDHRSLAVQREEALTAGDVIRSAELDRAPQTKLGWKASAMERRGRRERTRPSAPRSEAGKRSSSQGRWNEVRKFADRLLACGKEHDAAKSKERQTKELGKERDRGMGR